MLQILCLAAWLLVICIRMEDFYVTRTPRNVDICMKMSLAKYRGRKRGAYGLRLFCVAIFLDGLPQTIGRLKVGRAKLRATLKVGRLSSRKIHRTN